MCSFKHASNDDFSRLSPDLLQTWPKYFSLCWSILILSDWLLFVNDGLHVFVGDVISPWYPKHLSLASHLKGWYCSRVCLSHCHVSHPLSGIGNTNTFITQIFVAWVMFSFFQIFGRVKAGGLAIANHFLISTEFPPSLTIVDTMKLNVSTQSTSSSTTMLCCSSFPHIKILVFFTLR